MLHELQQQFVEGVFNSNAQSKVYQYISNRQNKTAKQQFNVYRSSIYGGMTKALAETYPVCKKLLGEAFFDAMLAHYISSHRSFSADLNAYGFELAEFIESFQPAASLPWLSDVVRLEWAWNKALSGADQKEGNLAEMSMLSNEQQLDIVFEIAEDASLLESDYPVQQIWQVNQDDKTKEQTVVDLKNGGVYLFVWRQQLSMRIDILQEEQYFFLVQIAAKTQFSKLCEELMQRFPHKDVAAILAESIQQGWIQGFSI